MKELTTTHMALLAHFEGGSTTLQRRGTPRLTPHRCTRHILAIGRGRGFFQDLIMLDWVQMICILQSCEAPSCRLLATGQIQITLHCERGEKD